MAFIDNVASLTFFEFFNIFNAISINIKEFNSHKQDIGLSIPFH
ncbi:hypothetical protein Psfp_03450 [Pelotomaculum sp. FP]|nr:hypothetical protein Psfp_03450 [Pelotomaculum sp. FP]